MAISELQAFPEAVGRSEAFLRCQEELSRAARVNRPVLLVGERGTGKELAARKLHYLSSRWQHPLVTLHCAALAPSLLESELFGHEAGSFTGARGRRAGRFEQADQSTLFLDEVGTIPPEVQEKILRVVEYGSFERVGGSRPVTVDVRIVGATNAHLPAMVAAGRFKADLLDRLAFEVIVLPPLRERGEDVLLLATHFAGRMAVELGLTEAPSFSDAALEQLAAYPWPGNVRELKNVVERSVYRCAGEPQIGQLSLDPFPPYTGCAAQVAETATQPQAAAGFPAAPPAVSFTQARVGPPTSRPAMAEVANPEPANLGAAVQELELRLLRQALAASRHNQRQAARQLGLSYHQFRGLYRKYAQLLAD